MKIVGLMLVFGGWLISVIGLNIASSNAGRLIMCLIGIATCMVGILGVLNKAFLKRAVWKQ